MKQYIFILLLLIGQINRLFAQVDTITNLAPISLNSYLLNISKGNLGYAAEQFNVTIAEANLKAAKVFPDPEVSFNYSNNQDQSMQMGQGVETGISYPISLGNKRGANIALSRSQYELSQLMLEEYFCNLRADATINYFVALMLEKSFNLQQDTYVQLTKLAKSDSLRLAVGDANKIDAMQSALEAKAQLNNVFQSKSDMQNAFTNLIRIQGKTFIDTIFRPSDNFPSTNRSFILSDLIANAQKNKANIRIAIKNREISDKNLRLVRANRAFEFSLEAGYAYNTAVKNELAPAPAFYSYNVGVSIPLKFSNANRGAIHAAKLAIQQSELNYKDIESQIVNEVIQAYNNFTTQQQKIDHYNHGLVDNAQRILESRIYAYQRGEDALIDVINAQHTYNNLRNDYLETILNYTTSLIELERAAGIWDLNQ